MKNVVATVEGNILHISIDLSVTGEVSKSGKSVVVATTEGNQRIDEAGGIKLGLNVYKPKR